jgi:hypothetical protein
MLGALLGAGLTDFGAYGTNPGGKLRAPCHLADGQAANVGATPVKRDTSDHHLDIFFFQTVARTVFAGNDAVIACLDTGLILQVTHGPLRFGVVVLERVGM